ncbi:GRAM domain-containing protein 4 isoform X1 [Ixodes scapularis]|uniref:GRAM domain-containing protein 4 isoform X1 n=1 Tax=Ixodes scapularis TaxID=6945 RepID=UPI001C38F161|nr:GRAM domain-containing protein 4 isoform X1 [Ixodes scapularis]
MITSRVSVCKKSTSGYGLTGEALCALLAILEISGHAVGSLGRCLDGLLWWWCRPQRPVMQSSADATRPRHRFPRRRLSYRRLAMMQSFEKRVASLSVPLKSMKNLSCPDLTKIGQSSPKCLSRAPSFGDSLGNCSDTMSVSDMGTDDLEETQYSSFLKNRDLLKTNRYLEDSDSSDCSHIEMRIPDDDAAQTLSDKSSQNDSGSPKLKPKTSYQLKHRRKAPVPLSPLAHQSNQIPSIKVTCETQSQRSRKSKQTAWAATWLASAKEWLAELQEDFSECCHVEVTDLPPKDDDEPFSLKYTKDTLFRFACVDSSLRGVQHECTKLIHWKSPLQTLLFIGAFLHGLWGDYLLTLLLFAIALGLIRNYVNKMGFLGPKEDMFTTDHKKLGIGMGIDKVPAIMSLNMKIAKSFHMMSDVFDKGMSLWTWRRPSVTMKVLGFLLCVVVYSLLRPTSEVIKVLGTLTTVKVFFLDYVFARFPKVRAKYDLAWILWNELPTGPEIERQARQSKKKEKLSKKKSDAGQAPVITINNNVCESRSGSPVSFREEEAHLLNGIFGISSSETCVPGWEQGRKCTLIKKERSLTSAFRNGRLYLTNNYLLFLRYKSQHPKNVAIPLTRIMKLEKGRPYSWIPGDGMSLVVTTSTGDVFTFGAVNNREDTFRSIVDLGLQHGFSWASAAEQLFQTKTTATS